jgi:FkbM family methyltransferase
LVPDRPTTSPRRTAIQWSDPGPDAALDATPKEQALRAEADRRGKFFDEASEMTPIMAVSDASGATMLVGVGDGSESRIVFSKPGRPTGHVKALRKAVSILKHLGKFGDDETRQFVDLGAGIGFTTISALRDHRFATAVSVEPNPDRYRLLRANLALNGLDGRATAIHARPVPGESDLALRPKGGWGQYRELSPDVAEVALRKSKAVMVPRLALDDLINQDVLDEAADQLVWVAMRDAAMDVLRGATQLDPKVSIVLDLDARALSDAARFNESAAVISARSNRLVDLNLGTRDTVVADAAMLGAIAERYANAKDRTSVQLLLVGA